MLISFLQITFASMLKSYKNLLTLGQNLNIFIIFTLHYPLIYKICPEKAQRFYDKISDKAKILLKVKLE